jgi:hypothetical protein
MRSWSAMGSLAQFRRFALTVTLKPSRDNGCPVYAGRTCPELSFERPSSGTVDWGRTVK